MDPFIGSGTTAVAAIKLNREYIGIDNNIGYIELARKRVVETKNGLVMKSEFQRELFPLILENKEAR